MDDERVNYSDPERPPEKEPSTATLDRQCVYLWYRIPWPYRLKKRSITRLYATDYFRKNWRYAAGKQVKKVTCYSLISTSSRKIVTMAWIDRKKSLWYDSIILDNRMSENEQNIWLVINFITEAMENWKMKLTPGGKILAEEKIKWDIFRGDSFSPLLSVIAMTLDYILRKWTGTYKFT